MSPPPRAVDPCTAWPVYDIATTRTIEHRALGGVPPHTLMQRAGMAVARLALAVAPGAKTLWIAAGPGNNGGDGLEAAACLRAMGKSPVVTWLGEPGRASPDAAASWQRARDAGVEFAAEPPADADLCIDALLGIGAARAPAGRMADWIHAMGAGGAPILAVDLPTGLNADTGDCPGPHVRASHTLSLLTLKPGLFTAMGRDAAGRVWLDDLQIPAHALQGAQACGGFGGRPAARPRLHASHKGSQGDVAIIGGAAGMAGAAVLAATAALHYGAGRVYLASLAPPDATAGLAHPPELMQRDWRTLDLRNKAVVCGCGGGDAVRAALPGAMSNAAHLVLDADALNALATDPQLQTLVRQRARRGAPTVLTPHPLEAARLIGAESRTVQRDRFAVARQLAGDYQCTVVLKGSGTLIASPGLPLHINGTGDPRLATAGTGDVLAGAIGAALAAGLQPHAAAVEAVFQHGRCADTWPPGETLVAGALARRLQAPEGGPTRT